jgi:lysophospholipase L1-like esterase
MALTTDQQFAIDFNLHEIAVAANLPIGDEAAAAIYGVPLTELTAYQTQVDADNRAAAQALAALPEMHTFLRRFTPGQRVLFLGDSITTYRYSYARVLTLLLEERGLYVHNRAYSGYTSTHGLELTYTQGLALQPDHVFIKYGVNDCKHFGSASAKMLTSLAEYEANLRAIVHALRSHSTARIVLLTPTQVVEPIVALDSVIRTMHITWRNEDLTARGDVIAQIAMSTDVEWVDLRGCLGQPQDVTLFCPDGLHPNAVGEQHMLMHIIRSLTSGGSPDGTQ